MGGLQSEALVVMVADPCPLWIYKLAWMIVVIAAGRPADRARMWGWEGELLKLAIVKCEKCVLVWRHDLEIYDENNHEKAQI